ncbi:hypothetical protein AB0L53_21970 [Nonomuraea sp. NPDC052129]|uniref:hypothetical protein n=1 Tax=Nonomuraea sp. NPDC052129 TaxID=3154651 RepID=UPI0034407ACB
MRRARSTLRALREDLRLPVPPIDDPLDEIDHPVLVKASAQFADDSTPHERIRAITDQVLFKVKIQRWRAAAWLEADLPWIIAAGTREDGAADDFYTALETTAKAARARYNAEHAQPISGPTYVGHLLPADEDRIRYQAESGIRALRQLRQTINHLTCASLHDGHEHAADLGTSVIGIQVRADDGHETYCAVRITGPVPIDLVALVLELIPGCDPRSWAPEARMPERALIGNEQIWSTLMDPHAAAKLLETHPEP